MTQRPSGSPNAGRINCFPTKTSQPFLSQPILSQSRPICGVANPAWPCRRTPPRPGYHSALRSAHRAEQVTVSCQLLVTQTSPTYNRKPPPTYAALFLSGSVRWCLSSTARKPLHAIAHTCGPLDVHGEW